MVIRQTAPDPTEYDQTHLQNKAVLAAQAPDLQRS
jgi:hypothetical protein